MRGVRDFLGGPLWWLRSHWIGLTVLGLLAVPGVLAERWLLDQLGRWAQLVMLSLR